MLLILLGCILISLYKIGKSLKISNLLLVVNAFFTTALIFATSKLYGLAVDIKEFGLKPTIKILIEQTLSTNEIHFGIFLLIMNLILLIVIILYCVFINTISVYVNQKQIEKLYLEPSKINNKINKTIDWIGLNPRYASIISIGLSIIIILYVIWI